MDFQQAGTGMGMGAGMGQPADGSGSATPQQDVSAQAIGAEQLRNALATLQKYKEGKEALETRIIEDERWYQLQHWEYIREHSPSEDSLEPVSAWLFNTIMNKHADAMDNYPEPNVLPRELSDEEDAKKISEVLPVVLERAEFEQTYSDNWWEKLKHGTSIYSVVWDPDLENGMGDIAVRMVDPLNLYWQPGIQDIQKSRNIFHVALVDNDVLEARWPQLRGKLRGQSFTMARYHHDENIDTSDMSVEIDWYYKRRVGNRDLLHYCKFVNDVVLFATENDPKFAERGWYDHGEYPFIFDTMFPEKYSPFGFGFVAIGKDPQKYIDKLQGLILRNSALATNPRYFMKDNSSINEAEYLDQSKKIVHVAGSLDETNIRRIDVDPVDGNTISVMQLKIDELKETSGNRDFNSGASGAGVTAASAIAALQEAGNKGSRDMISGSYRAYKRMDYQVLELMRQMYDEARYFRITGPNGAERFVEFSNATIGTQQVGIDSTGKPVYRRPIFDIKICAQKRSAISREVENQRATELYAAGFFNPERAQEAMIALDMMEFEGIDKVREQVQQGQTLMNMLQQMNAQMEQMAAMLQGLTGVQAQEGQEGGNGGGGAARGKGVSSGQSLGAAQSQAMTANSTPYAQQLAARATPNPSTQRGNVQ